MCVCVKERESIYTSIYIERKGRMAHLIEQVRVSVCGCVYECVCPCECV